MEKESLLQIVWKLPQQPSWSRELRLLQTEIIRLKTIFLQKFYRRIIKSMSNVETMKQFWLDMLRKLESQLLIQG